MESPFGGEKAVDGNQQVKTRKGPHLIESGFEVDRSGQICARYDACE